MLSTITSNIRESVLGGTSKYVRGGEPFGGAGVVVCARGERPDNVDGYVVVEAEDPALVSAVLFELRDALASVMDLDLRERLYPEVGVAAREACGLGVGPERTVDVMLKAAENALHAARRAYFAYGSNMDAAQMARRCPDARLVGAVAADGWQLWMDQAGYATIAEAPGERVEGALWDISVADELELDRYEGVASGCYGKRAIHVTGDGVEGSPLVYVSLRTPVTMETLREDYLERCMTAARELGLEAAVARLGSFGVAE
ncbi:gamma-glutamylcyclotransferase family protein [Paratractidigestivibacter sp.]|uniref:gamma-glutamylcyclotransferase family protein n=1 Tax=Paratractidigestivibacter sp. TaxID=2847316 RepID=UPI002ACB09D6|nr:gamma-glutamylcyclotransferase family protein [Paratractidigestivibacter sp.]